MFDLSAVQIIIVLVIALLVFGPKRLPELGRQLGKGLRELKAQIIVAVRRVRDPPDRDSLAPSLHRAAADCRRTRRRDADDDDLLDGVVVSGASAPEAPAPRPTESYLGMARPADRPASGASGRTRSSASSSTSTSFASASSSALAALVVAFGARLRVPRADASSSSPGRCPATTACW